MSVPSAHLSWAELACKDTACTPYPQGYREDGRLDELVTLFEAIRALWGVPLEVLSAYRTPAHNRSIGGAPQSQHVQGRALDLRPPGAMTPAAFYEAILAAQFPMLGGIGRYRTFVHVDVRPIATGGRLARWNGGAQLKDDRG